MTYMARVCWTTRPIPEAIKKVENHFYLASKRSRGDIVGVYDIAYVIEGHVLELPVQFSIVGGILKRRWLVFHIYPHMWVVWGLNHRPT